MKEKKKKKKKSEKASKITMKGKTIAAVWRGDGAGKP